MFRVAAWCLLVLAGSGGCADDERGQPLAELLDATEEEVERELKAQVSRDGAPSDLKGVRWSLVRHNADGRLDLQDARVLAGVVDRLSRNSCYGPFQGGLGLYRATRAHGPFVHVDVRGHPARWGP